MAVTAKANTARTGLPPIVGRIKGITDRLNNQKLQQVPLSQLRAEDPSQAFVGGFPLRYAVIGQVEVQFQPTAATGLWAVSSAAGDTTQTAYVETVTTGGYGYRDTKALNGLTRVQFGAIATRTDHIDVTRFYIGAAAVGYISLYDAAAAGNELARIEPGKTFARYQAVEWHPIQTADVTEYVDYTRNIVDLVNQFDEPLIPEDFHRVVVFGARMKECLFINDARYGAMASEYAQGKRDLMNFVMDNGDRIASLRPTPVEYSPFGAFYPSARWP